MLIIEDYKADLVALDPASQKLVYLALRMSERNWFLPVAIFQAAFRRRILLTVERSRMSRPPSLLGLQMSFQDLKWKPEESFSSWMPDHQNFLIIEVILAINLLEKRMVVM
jgi:hypothetical protein